MRKLFDSPAGNTRHDALTGKTAQPQRPVPTAPPAADTYPFTLFYESACPLCEAEMRWLMLHDTKDKLRFVDVSAPGFDGHPAGTTQKDLQTLIHGQAADGRLFKGVEVFRLAYEAAGMTATSRALGLPVLRQLAEWGYPVLARNRHRLPRALGTLLFGRGVRRAAARAAASRCDGQCQGPP